MNGVSGRLAGPLYFYALMAVLLTFFLTACKTSSPPAQERMQAYEAFLNGVAKENPNAIRDGVRYYQEHFAKARQTERDAAFLVFRNFYYRAFKAAHDEMEKAESYEVIEQQSRTAEYRAWLSSNGLALCTELGGFFIDEPDTFLLDTFGKQVSKPLRAYLELRKPEMRERWDSDAVLAISRKAVAERCLRWEAYLKHYPDSALHGYAECRYRNCLEVLLRGMDNSRVLDYHAPSPDYYAPIEEAYRFVLQAHPETRTGRLVAEYYPLVKQSEFRSTPETERFLEAHESEFTCKGCASEYQCFDVGFMLLPEK